MIEKKRDLSRPAKAMLGGGDKSIEKIADQHGDIPIAELVTCLDACMKAQGDISEETADQTSVVNAVHQAEQQVKAREDIFDRALKTEQGLRALLPHLKIISFGASDRFRKTHPELPLQTLPLWSLSLLERQLPYYAAELGKSSTNNGNDTPASRKQALMAPLADIATTLMLPGEKIAHEGNEHILASAVQALEAMYRTVAEVPTVDFPRGLMKAWEEDRVLEFLYKYAAQDISDEVRHALLEKPGEHLNVFYFVADHVPRYGDTSRPAGTLRSLGEARAQSLWKETLDKLDLSKKDAPSQWQTEDTLRDTALHALALESTHPGGVKLLAERFGIHEFGRYPVEVLRNQLKELESDKPYGLAIYPRSNDEAFQGPIFRLEVFANKLHDFGHTIRIIEVGNKIELARRIIELDNAYAKTAGKIDFALIHGHGTPDSIQLGAGNGFIRGKEHIITKDIWSRGAQRLSSFFRKRAPIVLDSCSTGKNAGIGQQLSAVFRTKVVAPDAPENLMVLTAKLTRSGNIDLDARYSSEAKPVTANTYVRGVLKEKRRK